MLPSPTLVDPDKLLLATVPGCGMAIFHPPDAVELVKGVAPEMVKEIVIECHDSFLVDTIPRERSGGYEDKTVEDRDTGKADNSSVEPAQVTSCQPVLVCNSQIHPENVELKETETSQTEQVYVEEEPLPWNVTGQL